MTSVAKVIHLPTAVKHNVPVEHKAMSSTPGTVASLSQRRQVPVPPGPEGHVDELVKRIGGAADFLRRRLTGDYRVDDFGYDEDLTETVFLPALRTVYERWFRVEVAGIDNIPDHGGALIVANHAGVVAWDALMIQVAVRDHHRARRRVRPLAADLVFQTPILATAARKAGATTACRDDAEKLLRAGELPVVFPEGFKGCGKPYKHRYQLQRFGRGGFAAVAVRTGAPIIPCAIIGSEETYPMLADLSPLAKLLGLPYFPVTPLFPHLGALGMIPLPSKWHIEFCRPIHTTNRDPDTADDPDVKSDISDQVRDTIQHTLNTHLARRRTPF